VKARLRPQIWPILPPVIIRVAITSVYAVIAVWIPTTVVFTSWATVAMDTFMTELSSVIRNCAEASVTSTVFDTSADCSDVTAIRAACHTAPGWR
jgi:hypothetical protein